MSLESIVLLLALLLILLVLSVVIIVVSTIVRALIVVYFGLRWVWRGVRWLRHPRVRVVARPSIVSLPSSSWRELAGPAGGREVSSSRRRRARSRRPGARG